MSDSSKRRRVAQDTTHTVTQLGQRGRGMAGDPREAVKARVRTGRRWRGRDAPPAHPRALTAPALLLLQARRWAQALRDIEDPLKDLAAVKRGVRGLLDVCKNGAPSGGASRRTPLPQAPCAPMPAQLCIAVCRSAKLQRCSSIPGAAQLPLGRARSRPPPPLTTAAAAHTSWVQRRTWTMRPQRAPWAWWCRC